MGRPRRGGTSHGVLRLTVFEVTGNHKLTQTGHPPWPSSTSYLPFTPVSQTWVEGRVGKGLGLDLEGGPSERQAGGKGPTSRTRGRRRRSSDLPPYGRVTVRGPWRDRNPPKGFRTGTEVFFFFPRDIIWKEVKGHTHTKDGGRHPWRTTGNLVWIY